MVPTDDNTAAAAAEISVYWRRRWLTAMNARLDARGDTVSEDEQESWSHYMFWSHLSRQRRTNEAAPFIG